MTPINLVLIASGSGTDANSIMEAWKRGQIPEINNIILVSTKPGAGCLQKAKDHNVASFVLKPPSSPLTDKNRSTYQRELMEVVLIHTSALVFLVGCVVILPSMGIPMYNIHPADPEDHGGEKMHGLMVHEHVLAKAIDLVRRGKKSLENDRFFTYPTVHEVTDIPDGGPPLLRGSVEIPKSILRGVLDQTHTLTEAADLLRDVVLPYEWQMLPAAVRMAAARLAA